MIHLPGVFEEKIREAVDRVPRLRHIEPDSILVLVHKMGASKHGQNAGLRHATKGRVFEPVFPTVSFHGREIYYAMSFHPGIVTSFFSDCSDPMEVVMHELWHVGFRGDGQLRRMRHGKQFNGIVNELLKTYYKNGGTGIALLDRKSTVRTRYWKNRQSPSISYVRRGVLAPIAREMALRSWQDTWTEDHVVERTARLDTLLPTMHEYICPNGHIHQTSRRFTSPRSCAHCSKRFDSQFLLKRLS